MLCCTSCKQELTREEAADVIIIKHHLPQTETIKIIKRYVKDSWGDRVGFFNIPKICIVLGDQTTLNANSMSFLLKASSPPPKPKSMMMAATILMSMLN